jgi:hypothetical protein
VSSLRSESVLLTASHQDKNILTAQKIRDEIEKFVANMDDHDDVVVYLGGHGTVKRGRILYLPSNYDPTAGTGSRERARSLSSTNQLFPTLASLRDRLRRASFNFAVITPQFNSSEQGGPEDEESLWVNGLTALNSEATHFVSRLNVVGLGIGQLKPELLDQITSWSAENQSKKIPESERLLVVVYSVGPPYEEVKLSTMTGVSTTHPSKSVH